MKDLEIFDKDGNALNVADVFYHFIKGVAEKNKKDVENVYVGVEVGFPVGKAPIYIHTTESVDNGYDAIDLQNFGSTIKVNSNNEKQ